MQMLQNCIEDEVVFDSFSVEIFNEFLFFLYLLSPFVLGRFDVHRQLYTRKDHTLSSQNLYKIRFCLSVIYLS